MTLLLTLLVFAQPGTLPAPYDHLNTSLDSLRVRYEVAGLAVAVVEGGEVTFARGYGWADLETRRPVTASTPFRIASLTKPLAATLLLRLAEQGRLDLDRPFAHYVAGYDRGCQLFTSPEVLASEPALRELTADWRCASERERLTVRHYLTHTAQGEPGTTFRYNGFLYGQLSRVVEGALGRAFADVLRDTLFMPLGMSRTLPSQADSSRPDLLSALALPYHVREGEWARSDWPRPLEGNAGAGVVSTVMDLARFDAALDRGVLLGPASRAAMTTPAQSASEALPYGLGWFVQDYGGHALVWHYGWQPGAYSALWLRVPERNATVILLANGDGLSAPFDLGEGDIARSPFARAFLQFLKL